MSHLIDEVAKADEEAGSGAREDGTMKEETEGEEGLK